MTADTEHVHKPDRRDFLLYYTTAAVGAAGAAAAVWPLVDQMNPDASELALAKIEVDVGTMEPGQQITVTWQGKPVFVRRRTQEEIEAARSVSLDDLKDPLARNANIEDGSASGSDENRTLDENGEWLVALGVCTHLGCVPIGNGSGDFGGWFCPCHGSHYDSAGRIRKGPAPENLPIPKAEFIDETTIRIG